MKIPFYSNYISAQKEKNNLMREGIVDFTIGQDPFYQGYKSVKIIFEYLFSGKTPESTFIQTKIDIRSRSNV